MTDFLLTILFAGIVGFIFLKLKVPGGMMFGAIFGAANLILGFGHAYMPYEMKVVAQMISGAFIAVGIDRNDLKNIKRLAKPLIILVSCMLVLNMISGFVIYNFSNLDITTAFFCAIPGGMSDIPIIAGEMGADSTQVALLQFVRMCVGISTFPLFIQFVGRKEGNLDEKEKDSVFPRRLYRDTPHRCMRRFAWQNERYACGHIAFRPYLCAYRKAVLP